MKNGPIIIIDDDADDKDMMEEALKDLKLFYRTIWFTRTQDAYDYLEQSDEQPFIIFSDINLPDGDGLAFKLRVDANPALKKKSIPFVFFSTAADGKTVDEVYSEMTVQGYFQKPNSYKATKDVIQMIVEYWKVCKHPKTIKNE